MSHSQAQRLGESRLLCVHLLFLGRVGSYGFFVFVTSRPPPPPPRVPFYSSLTRTAFTFVINVPWRNTMKKREQVGPSHAVLASRVSQVYKRPGNGLHHDAPRSAGLGGTEMPS